MFPELIIEELSIASAGTDDLKTVDLQKYADNLKYKKRPDFYTLAETIFINKSKFKQHKINFRKPFCRHC